MANACITSTSELRGKDDSVLSLWPIVFFTLSGKHGVAFVATSLLPARRTPWLIAQSCTIEFKTLLDPATTVTTTVSLCAVILTNSIDSVSGLLHNSPGYLHDGTLGHTTIRSFVVLWLLIALHIKFKVSANTNTHPPRGRPTFSACPFPLSKYSFTI